MLPQSVCGQCQKFVLKKNIRNKKKKEKKQKKRCPQSVGGQCSNGLYHSCLSLTLLFNSVHSSDFSFCTFFSIPLFSMALRDKYGRTSSTGPYGTYLYTE